jgi:hypothetical protein
MLSHLLQLWNFGTPLLTFGWKVKVPEYERGCDILCAHFSLPLSHFTNGLNAVIFWNIAPYSLYMNWHFKGMYHLCLQGWKSPTACWFHAQLIFYLKVEVIYSSETSVHKWTTRRCIPEDDKIHNCRCENLKSSTYELTWIKLHMLRILTSFRVVE